MVIQIKQKYVRTTLPMKKILITLAICLTAGFSFSKNISFEDVPLTVCQQFAKDFSHAEVVRWEITRELDYKVEFWEEAYYSTVLYDADGNFLQSTSIISWLSLPSDVKIWMHQNGIEKVQNVLAITDFHNEIVYQIEYSKNFRKHQLLLDDKATILN